MEYRFLGKSGLKVPVLSFGCATFGGEGALFQSLGSSGVDEARKLIDICLEAGANLFDTADIYSKGASEQILGAAVKGRREQVLISTKMTLATGRGPNEERASRYRLVAGIDAALKRLDTDYIDLLQLHACDALTPPEEILSTLDQVVRSGKVRYIGVSNYPSWQLMKALSVSDRYGWSRFVSHEVYYSLVARDYEWELMPLGKDQGVGALVWSPLAWGRLSGKFRRGQPVPEGSRLNDLSFGPPVDEELVYGVVDALDAVAAEIGKSLPQIAIAWLLSRPTVSSVIIGARNEKQLRDNLGAVGWTLTEDQIKRLDAASYRLPSYPAFSYRLDKSYARINPPAV